MDNDERTVAKYLHRRKFVVERFSKQETRARKTPDFRVYRNGRLAFYCEVKASPKDDWLGAQEAHAPLGLFGGARNDPIFNRLTTDIHTSVKQFDAVNKDQKYPNVLALVNHDDGCGFNDLLGVLTGNFYAKNGRAHPIYRQFSHGRIKNEKNRINLFIWIDDYAPDRLLFSQTDEALHASLCESFGINRRQIKQINR